MTNRKVWIARVYRVRPPSYWDDAVRRASEPAPPTPRARSSRPFAALMLLASLAVVGISLFALKGLVGGPDRRGSQPAEPGERRVETAWFVANLPAGWTPVVPDSFSLGNGVVAAQFTNFGAEDLVCVGEGGTVPSGGVLLRLTIGAEQGWEESLVLPEMEPKLEEPRGSGSFVDECGAARKQFAMFFGPDGHLMTAHVLFGGSNTEADSEAVSSILRSLEPTGHAPSREPRVWMAVAEGDAPSVGPWLISVQPALGGRAEGMFFHSEGWAFGIPIDNSSRGVVTGIGSGPNDQLLVIGVAPPAAVKIVLDIEGAPDQVGTTVALRDDGPVDRVAFFVGPFSGRLGVEGTELTPSATLIVGDDEGVEIVRQRLPE